MEILSHINKRVKHRPEISLPMLDLWRIYTESASSSIVRNFCIVYIEMAFERLPSEVSSFPLLASHFPRPFYLCIVKLTIPT
jgi:proteasome component ECM29